MKRILALTLVAFIALTILVSCGGNESGNEDQGEDNVLVGKWEESVTGVYEFKRNGTLTLTSFGVTFPGTYSINGDILTLEIDLGEGTPPTTYTGKFKVEDDSLYLYNDADRVSAIFTRVN